VGCRWIPHNAYGFIWVAVETHLIHAGYADVGRATRSRPIYNHTLQSQFLPNSSELIDWSLATRQ
jgi:hypothetical protein